MQLVVNNQDIRTLTEAVIRMKCRAKEQLTALSRNRNTETERAMFLEEIKRCEAVQTKLENVNLRLGTVDGSEERI